MMPNIEEVACHRVEIVKSDAASRGPSGASELSGAAGTPQGHGGSAPASAHGDSVVAVEPLCIGEKGLQVRNSLDGIMVS